MVFRAAEQICQVAFALEKIADNVEQQYMLLHSLDDYALKLEIKGQIQRDSGSEKFSPLFF